jgi:hypothetical protein
MTPSLSVAFGPQIAAAASRHGLDPRLLAAVAAQETGGPGADSGRNVVGDGGHGRGVFQIDDRWHPFARSPAAMDPAQNADYAAGLLASNIDRYGGDVHAALSAYNTGSPTATGTTTTWGDGSTLGYADSVLRHYDRISGGAAPASPPTAASAAPVAGSGTGTGDLSSLFGLFQQLTGSGAGLGAGMMPLQLPQRENLPAINENDTRDLAPDSAGATGDAT